MNAMTYDPDALWAEAVTFDAFVAEAEKHVELWKGVYRTAMIPPETIDPLRGRGPYRILVIAEDWCGDASNTVPVLARWADLTPELDLRIIKRDDYPTVMDDYLTNGTRSIPIAIVFDENGRELGFWGPRPGEVQAWVTEHKDRMPSKERYPHVRRWYARDRGRTTLDEVLAIMVGSDRDQ
jgi:hypothetical protein